MVFYQSGSLDKMPEERKEAYILLTYPRLLPFIMAAIRLLEIAYRNRVDHIGNRQVNEESEGTIRVL